MKIIKWLRKTPDVLLGFCFLRSIHGRKRQRKQNKRNIGNQSNTENTLKNKGILPILKFLNATDNFCFIFSLHF